MILQWYGGVNRVTIHLSFSPKPLICRVSSAVEQRFCNALWAVTPRPALSRFVRSFSRLSQPPRPSGHALSRPFPMRPVPIWVPIIPGGSHSFLGSGLIVEDGVGELVEIPVWTRRKAVASS